MTHEAVDSVGSLAAATEHWPGLRGWGTSHGLLYKLRGHVGEWMAAEHLTDAGCEVVMPEASNWPGHDLWVDGHPVNVKITSDAARVAAAALRSHPDVAVLVPGDAEHLPTDAIHFDVDHPLPMSAFDGEATVFVDDALSVTDATDATSDALDAASGHVDARLPWITIARSSIRELSLWNEGKTDLGRATKNVTIDAATIGGGAKAGAALGAKLGTLAGPGLGTAIGAAIGGVVGGLLGRTAARELREKPLREAREAFDRSREAYETAKSTIIEDTIRAWDLRLASADAELASDRQRIHAEVDAAIAEARDHVARATRLAAADRIELRAVAMRGTAAELAMATQRLERRRWVARVWPSERDAWARVSAPHLEAELSRLVGFKRLAAEGPDWTFLDALCQTTQGRRLVEAIARKNAQTRAVSLRTIGQASERALRDLAARRIEMVRTLEAEHPDLLARTQRRLDEVAAPARAARDALLSELRKAGVSVDEPR